MSKTAVISGVGSGLGAALVRKFASEGYQVGLLARSPDYIQGLAEELPARRCEGFGRTHGYHRSPAGDPKFCPSARGTGAGRCPDQPRR